MIGIKLEATIIKKIDKMIAFAEQQLGKPYIWGGNGPHSWDCSGLSLAILKSVDYFPAGVDVNAQDLFHFLSNQNWKEKLEKGSIVFYGRNINKITHVGICVDKDYMISAAGGDHTTTTVEEAIKKNACVKKTTIDYRRDLVAWLYPNK